MQSGTHIVNYTKLFQQEIDAMMMEITQEFSEPLSLPGAKLPAAFLKLPEPYWVSLAGDRVAGTAGIAVLANDRVALRKMFVRKEFRGGSVAGQLLLRAINWSASREAKAMYLGTMEQFRAAQRFYEKNGFERISKAQLPADFPLNPVDTVFYKLHLNDGRLNLE